MVAPTGPTVTVFPTTTWPNPPVSAERVHNVKLVNPSESVMLFPDTPVLVAVTVTMEVPPLDAETPTLAPFSVIAAARAVALGTVPPTPLVLLTRKLRPTFDPLPPVPAVPLVITPVLVSQKLPAAPAAGAVMVTALPTTEAVPAAFAAVIREPKHGTGETHWPELPLIAARRFPIASVPVTPINTL